MVTHNHIFYSQPTSDTAKKAISREQNTHQEKQNLFLALIQPATAVQEQPLEPHTSSAFVLLYRVTHFFDDAQWVISASSGQWKVGQRYQTHHPPPTQLHPPDSPGHSYL